LLASPHLAGLVELCLRNCQVSPAAVRVLCQANLPALRFLDLASNAQLGDAGAVALAAAPFLPQLTDLDLTRPGLGDAGAIALAGSGRLPRLRRLVLGIWSGNRVGGEGIRALVSSPGLPALAELLLASNPIGPAGAEALAGWPPLAQVR